MARQKGFALMLVIWSLITMSGMATGFAFAVRHETRAAADLASRARAQAAAEAALRFAVLALGDDDRETRWQANGLRHKVPWPEADITVAVQAESGRMDLNLAPRELLVGLFEQVLGEVDHEALADAVIDWRDRDDEPGLEGAEYDEYARAGYAYGPSNRPFQSVHELSRVMGFDRDTDQTLAPYLTIYGRMPRINAISAHPVVLAAVPDISLAEAEDFVRYRDSALAAGERLDFAILQKGRRFLDTRVDQRAYALMTEVTLPDGTEYREHAVVRIAPGRGFEVWSREVVRGTTQPLHAEEDNDDS